MRPAAARARLFLLAAIAAMLCFARGASAQELLASIDLPNPVVGDTFTYAVTARNTEPKDLRLSSDISPNLRVLGYSGMASNIQISGGQTSMEFTYSWRMEALAEGPFTIGPASGTARGQKTESNPITGKITQRPNAEFSSLGRVAFGRSRNATLNKRLEGNYFSVTEVPAVAYPMQAVPVKTWIYRHASFNPRLGRVSVSSAPGGLQFMNLEEATQRQMPERWESIDLDGEPFLRGLVDVTTLVPTRPGKATISGLSLMVEMLQGNSRSFFDTGIEVSLPAQTRDIEILPLPAPLPGSAAQVVGTVTAEATVDRKELKEGDLLTLLVRLSGEAYLEQVSLAGLDAIDGFAKVQEEVAFQLARPSPLISRKEFKVILQATKPGTFEIPALQISQFNPESGVQVPVSTRAVKVSVSPGAGSAVALTTGTAPAPGMTRAEAREVGEANDILFIDKAPLAPRRLGEARTPVFARAWYWALHLVPAAISLGIAGFLVHRRRLRDDPAFARSQRSRSRAQGALREAMKNVNGARGAFYTALSNGVMHHVGWILGREASGLTADEAVRALRDRGAEPGVCDELFRLLDRCDAMRYAPAGAAEAREDDLAAARRMITSLEKLPR